MFVNLISEIENKKEATPKITLSNDHNNLLLTLKKF
jgi:hypothetical protein